MSSKIYRIGVDVGGTNTDCIILDPSKSKESERGIICSVKASTTPDVTSGIKSAIAKALEQGNIPRDAVAAVMIGTTHFVNAVVQADSHNLRKVAVLRLCGPYTREVPSFCDFPPALARIMNGYTAYLDGGLEIDGRDITPLSEKQIRNECVKIRELGISDIALVGVFSPLDTTGRQEEKAKVIILEEIPGADVVLSKDIGNIGFLERENASILNASIIKFARKTIAGFVTAMKSLGLSSCPLLLTQNDGTLIDTETAKRCPIRTFSSGPTNSMSGASYLADLVSESKGRQVIVADIGGTTTDICALLPSGFPREAGAWVEVGGVRCASPRPEVLCLGLGGGTKVLQNPDGSVTVGPESVGHRLLSEALVFGGTTLTATDVAVAEGKVNIGDAALVSHLKGTNTIQKTRQEIKQILERGVDSMKLSAEDAVLVLVGGGSIVQMDEVKGKLTRYSHFDCANAVGAAIAKVSGQIDTIEILEGRDEQEIIESTKRKAIEAAIEAGADRDTVKIVSLENLPLEYSAVKATRLIIKAAGMLRVGALLQATTEEPNGVFEPTTNGHKPEVEQKSDDYATSASASIKISDYKPEVLSDGTWLVSEADCEFLATGCSVVACGGGGPGYNCYLAARAALRQGKQMRVVDISTMPDDTLVFGTSTYGAPAVVSERLPSGTEAIDAIDGVLPYFGIDKPGAVIADEIGGMNGLRPLLTSIHYDVPTIDGDYMGRAYPRIYHSITYVNGLSIVPCAQADDMGNTVAVSKCEDPVRLEKLQRKAALELGLLTQMSQCGMRVGDLKKYAVLGSTSLAWHIGRAIYQARQEKTSIVDAILRAHPCGRLLYTGKIIDVRRFVSDGGYTEGSVRLRAIGAEEREVGETVCTETRDMVLPFQNEYLYAALQDEKQEEVICTVPDLISLIGMDGYALGTQDIKYGLRVNVMAFVGHPHWYTERGLELGGPKDFGYKDMKNVSVAPTYYDPPRVTDMFRPR
ncbi:hypothetical protein B0J15DRAFT_583674 [Fusarium solani]|uniref:Hydantoinase n=1 Tax=Fusarium solani TaxID=169388 RepID=A0A9P9KMD6_FUSSL|nr:uncharacterized protein B0J15DRAFT_583674 [Fusarium solani]KAH7258779.1 hypothetical protein B0J15DRAFT_583674 [Fusarium solani]